jgi:putative transposase
MMGKTGVFGRLGIKFLSVKLQNLDFKGGWANRHFLPGYFWHITHGCHKREFLLKFAWDRRRWLEWLLEAERRYGVSILNYSVSSNRIHLREVSAPYVDIFAGENVDLSRKNTFFWEQKFIKSAS